ncbi:ubiquitin carboxyl-terminal hydrolase-related protein [Actinidia rufa]|uniref:Ubiquitin carboxyl-terminal hydrolase-related protein n=1 Tax=Actinidia rufa TaxID=165716 RepID=A0A7J0EKT2_9ERIC|nr:ubiquitin carboxyl-terminal hydrolase-related protein [Actinidia rufa]
MAPKNRNLPLPITADTASANHCGATPIQEHSDTESVDLLPLRRNNDTEFLRLIEETCLRHPNSVIAHRTQAHIHHQAASKITDPATKQQHLQNAVVSARRTVTLSSGSIEHVDFLCGLLIESASDARAHEEVVRECERALAVEDPIDPADDTKVEERIESVRVELQSHMQKSRAAVTDEIEKINVPKEKKTNVPRKSIKETTKDLEAQFANLKNIVSSEMKIYQSRAYWAAMSEERRRGFLELKIGDLKEHFRLLKDDSAMKAFLESLDYADKNKTWKSWPCFWCDEKFAKVELRLKHIEKFHKEFEKIARKLRDYVPQEIDPDWAKLLVHGTWKPVDIPRALEIIRNHSKSELGNEDKDPFSCEVPKKEDEVSEDKDLDDITKLKKIWLPKAFSDNQNWPLSDDIKRAKTLESIHGEFQLLMRREYLSMKNLSKVIGYAIDQLQKFVPASELRVHDLDRTPLCICFLGVFQLNSVLNFLQHLSSAGNVHMVPHTGSLLSDFKGLEFEEGIVFTGNPSYILDEQFLKVEFMPQKYLNASATCKIRDDEVDVIPDGDALMHYLFDSSATIGELSAIWRVLQDSIKRRGLSSLETLEKEFIAFQGLYKFCSLTKLMKSWRRLVLRCGSWGQITSITTSLDYRSIVLPLLKLFMKAQMEALVDENARQKADAVQIAILSELEPNAKKNTIRGGGPMKHPKDKSMVKKKNKDNKISKDPKATRGDELNVVQEEKEEEPHLPAGQTAGSPRSVTDELKQQEEEEIKLKEMFERKRLIEDEAKQKNLAKQTTDEASDSVIRLNLEASGSVIQLNLEASCHVKAEIYVEKMQLNLEGISSVMAHQDPSLRKRKMPEDFSGAPVSAKSPKVSSRASVSRKNRGSRSHSKVKQVLDMIPAQKNLPLTTSQSEPSVAQLEESEEVLSGMLAPGMKNDDDEFNCILNVVVQSFWHLETFRDEFLSRSKSAHVHFGNPCVVCALHEGQQNDASEVLFSLLDVLHLSFTPNTGLASQKCDSNACIAHRFFDVDIVKKLICQYCGIESRQQKYRAYSYIFHAEELISAKALLHVRSLLKSSALLAQTMDTQSPLDELLKLGRNQSLTCDPAVKGCGKDNNLHHILSIRPLVFTIVLVWGTPTASIDDISKTLEVLNPDIDLGVVFDGLDRGHKHFLISMVCYGGRHYICFVHNCYHQQWILYDDEIVQVIGSWKKVTLECKRRRFQPTVLFFESQ